MQASADQRLCFKKTEILDSSVTPNSKIINIKIFTCEKVLMQKSDLFRTNRTTLLVFLSGEAFGSSPGMLLLRLEIPSQAFSDFYWTYLINCLPDYSWKELTGIQQHDTETSCWSKSSNHCKNCGEPSQPLVSCAKKHIMIISTVSHSMLRVAFRRLPPSDMG